MVAFPAVTEQLPSSLIQTKLQRPRVGRGLVARPHLLEQLNASHNLTLVLAPAGYGKTTLLSSWLETRQQPYAWLALDEHDDDPGIFATYLISALHTLIPISNNTLAGVNGATLPPPSLLARSLLNDLATVEQDVTLVLDDYHVIRHQAIHDLVIELVRYLPPTLHLVIASRHDPPLPLANLRAHDHVTELRAADLRFTLEETEQFLIESMALTLDEQAISALAAKTEGWPAGLRLVALSLRQPRTTELISANAPRNDRYVADYLVAEVLSQLPISIQEFLIKTSILDRLCGPLCEAVTSMTARRFNGQSVLEWLERTDWFLTPIDDGQYWYRCHPLFRQILRDRLEQRYGPTEIAALHRRASVWFAENGYLEEALQHALAANDTTSAAQIVAQHRHELMNQSQWQQLDRWVKLFPRDVVDQNPDLLLAEVWLKFVRQQQREVAPLLDRAEALLPGLPSETARRLQGEVECRRSALLYWNGDIIRSGTLAQQALEKIPYTWWYVRVYARLFLSNSYLTTGDLSGAYATFYSTDELDAGKTYHNFLLAAASILHWVAADPSSMAQAARQVVTTSDPLDRAELVTFARHNLGLYYYQRNELAEAEKYLLPLVLQPYQAHAQCFLHSAVLLARMCQVQNRPEEANQIVDVMLSFAFDTLSDAALFIARAFQAELALRQGRAAEAIQWAAHYGPFRRVPMPFAFVPPLVLVGTLLAQNTPASRQQTRELLSQMDDYYSSIHYTAIRIRVLALQALLYSAEGDDQQALAVLSTSLGLAEPGGFLRLFVDLGTALKPLLQKLAQQGVSPAYVTEILAAYGPGDAFPRTGRAIHTESASSTARSGLLTNRELDVLHLLAQRYTNKEIADALVISPKTVNNHLDHLGDKLGVHGRRAIVAAAKDQGLLD
ncbi:MAG TPA: LuxR C-terminal-related transcriptional regulator [Anaerolineae bacterium]|nr:LuxR C-terminal-related transcriptional regulator [Anaerolineae bacterium]